MDGTYTGQAEALVRAPGMTGLNAQELVEVAESSGLIIPLGRWILRQASAIQLSANKKGAKLCMSINVSAKQFNDDMFWEQFRGQALLGMFPEGVTLEVTETTLMEDSARSARLLREARDLGAKVALDDFGCGYSSLSTLKRMPLDKLKLDKSLIDEVPESNESTRVAQAAIVMAQALGLEVVAEGIEREEQARWLASKGVRFGQGFLYAKAMDPELLIELSANGVLPVFLANK
jgi:EAL domain-containing protein (putative c-di-GMP-specific phosphodiesterase class I)